MVDKDLYEILGISKEATDSEVRKAFLGLAKKHHPDRNPGDKAAEQKFKEVNFAHEVLKDKKKRAQYDQMRSSRTRRPSRGGSWAPEPEGFNYESFSDFGLGDLFQEIFGGGAGFAGQGQRAGGRRAAFQERGSDREGRVQVSFVEAARGVERAIDFSDGRRIMVKIPAGVETGSKIRLSGQGEPGVNGGPNGDLILSLEVAAHAIFRREALDIVLVLPISFSEAVLGGEVEVPTLDGKVVMKIPRGVSSGQRLKLRGKGVKKPDGATPGDQVIELQIRLPKDPDSAYTEAAEGLKSATFNPREEFVAS
jgi:DnaJ-class molecular chaperone